MDLSKSEATERLHMDSPKVDGFLVARLGDKINGINMLLIIVNRNTKANGSAHANAHVILMKLSLCAFLVKQNIL